MKLTIEKDAKQIELLKAIGSKNRGTSLEASEIFAAFLSDVTLKVIQQASTAGMLYNDIEFDEDDSPSVPLDLYYNTDVGYVTVTSQSMAGGLPSNTDVSTVQELKVSTYSLDSAFSVHKKYFRKARLDVVAKLIERNAQELLIKQERNAWAVVMKALAEAQTKANKHVLRCGTTAVFNVDDLSKLLTRAKRVNMSFASGTPDSGDSKGITDIFVSPEIKEKIRAFAYNPLNTVNGAGNTAGNIALPDNVREGIYRAAGAQEIFGITIHELMELGSSQKYNRLFSTFAGSTQYDSVAFTEASQEILVAADMGRDALKRPVAIQSESGGQILTVADDQFVARSDKAGWFSKIEEGRVCLDSRMLFGLIYRAS